MDSMEIHRILHERERLKNQDAKADSGKPILSLVPKEII